MEVIKLSTSRKAFPRDFPSRGTDDLIGGNVRRPGEMEMAAEGEANVSHIMQEVQHFHETQTDRNRHMKQTAQSP